jgi:hypothetical protein
MNVALQEAMQDKFGKDLTPHRLKISNVEDVTRKYVVASGAVSATRNDMI